MWRAPLQRLLTARFKRRHPASKAWKPRRLILEPLEDRVTPTALNLVGNEFAQNLFIVDVTASGGIYAYVNGNVTTFDPGTFDAIDVFPGLFSNFVDIRNTNVPVFVERGGTSITGASSSVAAFIGNGADGVQGINANIDLTNSLNTDLIIEDGPDSVGQVATISPSSVTGLAPASILFSQLSEFRIDAGQGGNVLTVTNTGNWETIIDLGGRNDSLNVQATTGILVALQDDGGNTTVNVGSGADTLDTIQGPLDLIGYPGTATLNIDDQGSVAPQLYTLSNDGQPWAYTTLSRSGAADITYGPFTNLSVSGGSGDNTFNVLNTSAARTTLITNSGNIGNDNVYVRATHGILGIFHGGGYGTITVGNDAGSLDSIQGHLNIVNFQNENPVGLFLLDQGTVTPQSYTISNHVFTRSGVALIDYDSNISLSVVGGSGGNSFNIWDTVSLATTIETGTGNDFVRVQGTTGGLNVNNTGGNDTVTIGADVTVLLNGFPILLGRTLANINGSVAVYGAGSTSLYVDDSADTSGPNGAMYDGELTGLSPSPILWTPSTNPTGGVTYLNVKGGIGTGFNQFNIENHYNTFTIFDTSNLYSGIYLLTNNDSALDFNHFHLVSIVATTGRISVDGGNGAQLVVIGSPTVANINGMVDVFNLSSNGWSELIVDDTGDSNNKTVNLYDGTVTGLAPAPIEWTSNSPTSGGVGSFSALGGSGANTFNVFGTGNFFNPTVFGTPSTGIRTGGNGLDTVNVRATSGVLVVQNFDSSRQGSPQTDTIGSLAPGLGGTLANINGPVYVSAVPGSNLIVDDGGDTTSRAATLTTSLFGGLLPFMTLTGMSPASINWSMNPIDSPSVAIDGGSGGNSFNVLNTGPSPTTIHAGLGNDFVHVQSTTGPLNLDNNCGSDTALIGADVIEVVNGFPILLGRTLANINGSVDVYGSGSTALYVDDSADSSGPNGSMYDGELTGLSPAPIFWTPSANPSGGVTSLNVKCGTQAVLNGQGTLFTVFNTSNLYYGTYLLSNSDPNLNFFSYHSVEILATTGTISVDGGNGQQLAYIGGQLSHPVSLVNINGSVDVFNSGSGDTQLLLDDTTDPITRTIYLYNGKITGLAPAPILWTPDSATTGGVEDLEVDGGNGDNSFYVVDTSDFFKIFSLSASTGIVLGAGQNTVNIQGTSGPLRILGYFPDAPNTNTITIGSLAPTLGGSLANIRGNVELLGPGKPYHAIVDDSGDSMASSATLTIFKDHYGSYPAELFLTGMSPAVINVNFALALAIYAGSGDDSLTISDPPTTPVSFNGGGGTNTLIGPNAATSFNITGVNSGSLGNVTFTSVQNLLGGAGNDAFAFQAGGSLSGSVNGGGAVNTIIGPNVTTTFSISCPNGGAVGSTNFASIQNLIGGSANNTFAFRTFGSLTGSINGGTGATNTLDYSKVLGTVVVDLPLGKASGVGGSIGHIQNVTGSIGNDLIVGDGNANMLQGGTGRNIIIGGAGPDQITGGGGDNILIGGATIWDANMTALNAIFQAWTNTTLGFDQRVNALRQGIVVGGKTYALNSSTVHADSSPDSLIGGSGRNWFFLDFDDIINNGTGPGPNDRVTRV
jgi:hypothetical protein